MFVVVDDDNAQDSQSQQRVCFLQTVGRNLLVEAMVSCRTRDPFRYSCPCMVVVVGWVLAGENLPCRCGRERMLLRHCSIDILSVDVG